MKEFLYVSSADIMTLNNLKHYKTKLKKDWFPLSTSLNHPVTYIYKPLERVVFKKS